MSIQALIEEARLEGRLQGRLEARREMTVDHLRSLMRKLGCSLSEAMDILKVPEDKRDTYEALLRQQG